MELSRRGRLARRLLCLTLVTTRLGAQHALSLPPVAPLSPDVADRTGLYVAPYEDARAGWQFTSSLEYGSAVERQYTTEGRYLLDEELLRLSLRVQKDLSPHLFVNLWVGARGTYAGFADPFLNWVHDRIGLPHQGRQYRPTDTYGDTLWFYAGPERTRPSEPFFLDDTRLEVGWRHESHWQSLLSLTLPTSTASAYGRHVPTVNLIETVRFLLWDRLTWESTAAIGFSPTTGDFAAWQNELMALGATGVRVRLFDGQSIYLRGFYHAPLYSNTPLSSFNQPYWSADFGWIARLASGHEIRGALVEDIHHSDLNIDMVAVVGVTF